MDTGALNLALQASLARMNIQNFRERRPTFEHLVYFDFGVDPDGFTPALGSTALKVHTVNLIEQGTTVHRLESQPTVAHEIGHSYGFGDSYYPPSVEKKLVNPIDPPCELCPSGGGGTHGCPVEEGNFDSILRQSAVLLTPADVDSRDDQSEYCQFRKWDFMGRPGRLKAWVDRRLWRYLYGKIARKPVSPRAQLNSTAIPLRTHVSQSSSSNTELLTVVGFIGAGDTGGFVSVTRFSENAPVPEQSVGPYSVELHSSSSQVLQARHFEAEQLVVDGSRLPQIEARPFIETLPWASKTTRIVLKKGSLEIASQSVSPNPPVVQLQFPTGADRVSGKQTIRWTGTDPDGDPLRYAVYFSSGNGSWLPIVQDLTVNSFDWDTSAWPGGANCRIRVVANDGVNEGFASSAPFSVSTKPPHVLILTPQSGLILSPDQSTRLQGLGFDLEDGELSGPSLTYTSNLDGVLGHGSEHGRLRCFVAHFIGQLVEIELIRDEVPNEVRDLMS